MGAGPALAVQKPLFGQQLQGLVIAISSAYWQTTVGPLAGNPGGRQTVATIAGYKAPASVVTVTRTSVPA